MPFPDLIIALTVLLLTPGPTNTLMALAGAERGVRAAAGVIPAELGAYLCVVVPLAVAGAGLMSAVPGLLPLVTAAAAAWVLWLAIRMWRCPMTARRLSSGASAWAVKRPRRFTSSARPRPNV